MAFVTPEVRVARGQRPRQNGVVPPLPMPRESQVEAAAGGKISQ